MFWVSISQLKELKGVLGDHTPFVDVFGDHKYFVDDSDGQFEDVFGNHKSIGRYVW